MEDLKMHYKKDYLTVVWQPHKCTHSTNCWKGLGDVFKPKEKPWIQVEGASHEHIMAQVQKCPSGALSFVLDETVPADKKI